MKCVDCGRKVPIALKKCMYCGGAAESNDVADAPVNCASCNTTMDKITILGITIDECPRCKSRWFDRDELEDLIKKKREVSENNPAMDDREQDKVAHFEMKQTKVEYRKCPRCQNVMSRRNYEQISGVMIDSCPPDGIFLDAGEFDRLRAFVETEGPSKAKGIRDEERQRHKDQMEKLGKAEHKRALRRTGRHHLSSSFDYDNVDSSALSLVLDLADGFVGFDW
jgi:Zn-finger nucleic acid-binding protein